MRIKSLIFISIVAISLLPLSACQAYSQQSAVQVSENQAVNNFEAYNAYLKHQKLITVVRIKHLVNLYNALPAMQASDESKLMDRWQNKYAVDSATDALYQFSFKYSLTTHHIVRHQFVRVVGGLNSLPVLY